MILTTKDNMIEIYFLKAVRAVCQNCEAENWLIQITLSKSNYVKLSPFSLILSLFSLGSNRESRVTHFYNVGYVHVYRTSLKRRTAVHDPRYVGDS